MSLCHFLFLFLCCFCSPWGWWVAAWSPWAGEKPGEWRWHCFCLPGKTWLQVTAACVSSPAPARGLSAWAQTPSSAPCHQMSFLEARQLQGPRSVNHHDYQQQEAPWGSGEVMAGGEAVSELVDALAPRWQRLLWEPGRFYLLLTALCRRADGTARFGRRFQG